METKKIHGISGAHGSKILLGVLLLMTYGEEKLPVHRACKKWLRYGFWADEILSQWPKYKQSQINS